MWEYRPGRVNVADPLSRHPSLSANVVMAGAVTAELAQLTLCSVTDTDTRAENDEAAATDAEMLSQIVLATRQTLGSCHVLSLP